MKFEFVYEMDNGDVGSYIVFASSLFQAKLIIQKENNEVLDCLLEVNEYENH